MVQASLNDQNIPAAVRERKLPAIGNRALGVSAVLREQMRGQVDAFESRESESLQSVKPVAAAAKQLDNFGVARPAGGSQIPQPFGKFLNLLLRCLKPLIGGFPLSIRSGTHSGMRRRILRQLFHVAQAVSAIFHVGQASACLVLILVL